MPQGSVFCKRLFNQNVDLRVDFGPAGKAYPAHVAEVDYAGFERKKGVVFAGADITAGDHFEPALAHDNSALFGDFARKELNAKVFGV